MDVYVNPRIANVRIVQYVTAATAVFLALMLLNDGEAAIALIVGVIGVICVIAFDRFYIRQYVTRLRQDASGWTMTTLTTFGERQVQFDPREAQLGGEITQNVRYGGVNYHYPFFVSGKRYILDSTPPVQIDLDALRRAFAH